MAVSAGHGSFPSRWPVTTDQPGALDLKGMTLMASVFLLTGCFPFGEYKLMNSSLLATDYLGSPRPADEVGVFIGDDVPPAECDRVALLRAAPTATVVDRLREEAGRLGANAVDLRDFRSPADARVDAGEGAWNAVALFCPSP